MDAENERSEHQMKRYRTLTALFTALALALVAGCSAQPTAAPEPAAQPAAQPAAPASKPVVSVKISQPVDSLSQLPVYVARGLGYFGEEGLAVDQIATQGGGPDQAALLAGDVQFNVAPDTYHIDLLRQGKKTLGVFNYQNQSIITMAMRKDVAEQLGITADTPLEEKLTKLKGLNIGVTRAGTLTDKVARYYVGRAGFDPDNDTTIVGVGSGPPAVAALEHGSIDVLVVSVPQPELAVQRGIAVQFLSVGEDPQMPGFLMNSISVMPAYADKNPEVVRAFVTAVQRAIKWMETATAAQIADVVQLYLPSFDRDLLEAGIDQVKRANNATGTVTREQVAITIELMGVTDITVDQVMDRMTDKFLK
jgi:NitT/TauT family transport system substrate-binding protein